MTEQKRSDGSVSVGMPDSIALLLHEKDRVIRSQEKRIENLEYEVILLRADRDRLNTKVSLLSAQRIQGPSMIETHRSSHDHRPATVSVRRSGINQVKSSYDERNDIECSCDRLNVNRMQFTRNGQIDCTFVPSFTNLNRNPSNDLKNAGPTRKCVNLTRAQNAAIVIQNAYRKYHTKKNFARLCSTVERKRRLNEFVRAKQTSTTNCNETKSNAKSFCKPSKNVEAHDNDEEFLRLKTIEEHCIVGRNAEDVTYQELSDGSDSDSIVDAVADEPSSLFDVSSTAFENVLEIEENRNGACDDSFNSDDSHDGCATSSRSSTLRSCDTFDVHTATTTYTSADEETVVEGSPMTVRNVMRDSVVCSDSEFLTTPEASMSSNNTGSILSQSAGIRPFNYDGTPSNFYEMHSHLGAFVRFRMPGASPIWKRKTGQMGSTGSLPESSLSRASQISRSSDPSELGTSISDVSQQSDGSIDHSSPMSVSVMEASGQYCRGDVDTISQPYNTYQQTDWFRGVDSHETRLEIAPCSLFPCASTFCTTGAYQESDKLRKRIYRIGLNLFNKKPDQGVQYLIENRFIDFRPNAVARFLISRKGISKQMIGEYLGNIQKQFNLDVLRCFSEEIDLKGLELDVALRKYQSYFRMPGEAQKIERLIEVFSLHYCNCNLEETKSFRSPDTIFLLAFAVIMLNTDQHNKSIKEERRMTRNDFFKNLRGIDDGFDVNENLLNGIYERIRSFEFTTGSDHVTQVAKIDQMIVGNKPQLVVPHRRLVCYCRLHEVTDITKKEKVSLHQREIFLFNDLLLVTKMLSKKKKATSMSYSFRQCFSLIGMAVYLFETPYYKFGVRLVLAESEKVLITLCAQNEHDRIKFIEDLREAIYEIAEMEVLKTLSNRKNVDGQGQGQRAREVNRHSKDSGVVVDVDQIVQQMSTCDCNERKNSISESIIDVAEHQRRGSHGSLDSGMVSAGSGSAKSYTDDGRLTYTHSLKMPSKSTSSSAAASSAAAAVVTCPTTMLKMKNKH